MSEYTEQLIRSLAERDALRGYVSRLEDLVEQGEITAAQGTHARADYEQRIAAVEARLEPLRSSVQHELDAIQLEARSRRADLRQLEARHKVGELSASKYQGEVQKLQSQLSTLEQDEQRLACLVTAESTEGLAKPVPAKPEATRATKTAKSRAATPEPTSRKPRTYDLTSAEILPRTPVRIAAVVVALLLLLSVRMPWLGASELLGADLPSEPGVNVSFIAGLAGLVCGLAAIGVGFLPAPGMRGTIHTALGLAAGAALVLAVVLRELPLFDSYFRELVTLEGGFFVYVAAAFGLAVLGIAERTRAS